MFRHAMAAATDEVREGYHLERPNRRKAASKLTKYVVVLLMLVSVVLLFVVTAGGWQKLAGAKSGQVAYIIIYLVMAFFVLRWNRGVLPLAAALAIVLGIFAAISGPEWFNRDHVGYAQTSLGPRPLGLLTLLIVPVQVLLIAFAMRGFSQGWNVEVEVRDGERYDSRAEGGGQPATA